MAILSPNHVQDILSAIGLGILGLERVALNHQQGVVVALCQVHGFPGQHVMVDVAAPLCHHLGLTVAAVVQVEHSHHAPVSLVAAAAHVHRHQIAQDGAVVFGLLPHLQRSIALFDNVRSAGRQPVALDVACDRWRQARLAQAVELSEVKHAVARVAERLNVVARKLLHHLRVRAILFALAVIPR